MPERYMCAVLDEMRAMHKTRNYSGLLGLIEEVQTMANRMEAAIGEKDNYQRWHKRFKEEKAKYKKLLKKTNKLRKENGEMPVDMPGY